MRRGSRVFGGDRLDQMPIEGFTPTEGTPPTRRQLLLSGAALLAIASIPSRAAASTPNPALTGITADGPFTRSTVVDIARALAKSDFVPLPSELPDPIKNLSYEQYRDIRSNRAATIW